MDEIEAVLKKHGISDDHQGGVEPRPRVQSGRAAQARSPARPGDGGLDDPATPLVVVDLDAFDANAADLIRRAAGTPIRVASKSLRIPALLERVLALPGFHGVLSYTLREALWLVRNGVSDDVVMGYPIVDSVALRDLLGDDQARRSIALMVDDPAHLRLIEEARPVGGSAAPARVAIDIDAGLTFAGALPSSTWGRSARRSTTPSRSSPSPATSSAAATGSWA